MRPTGKTITRTAGWLWCALLALALALALAGCGAAQSGAGGDGGSTRGGDAPAAAAPPDEAPYVRGEIVSVAAAEPVTTDCVSESDLDPDGTVSSDDPPVCNPNPSVFGSVHVKGNTEVVATVGKTTPIMRRVADDAFEPVAFEDLAAGDAVAVWMQGPIMESFPAQGGAAYVLVED